MLPTKHNQRRLWVCGSAALLLSCAQREAAVPHGASRGPDIVVTGSSRQRQIGAGESADFDVLITNKGPSDAPNVHIVDTVGRQSSLISISCRARGNALCPDPLQPSMGAASLPSGGSLEFLVKVELANHGTGTIVNSLSAGVIGDTNPNDNVVTNDVLVR